MFPIPSIVHRNPIRTVAVVLTALVFLRLVSVILSPLNIGPDEAQYWRWSTELDWGYYSKPPLIAWMISLTTSIFGHSEWAIRFYAPFGHGFAAFFLFLLGKKAFDVRTGAWAAAIYMMMPGVWLSSNIISTDGLLLPCWSAAITLLWYQRENTSWLKAILMGLAIGFAFLAKYAAIYILVGFVLAAIVDKKTRQALLSWKTLATLATGFAVILPNILWNAAHDFATLGHTADNANWENSTFNPENMIKFFQDQMGVFGPVSFIILLGGLAIILPKTDKASAAKDRWFLCFILPALIIIAGQAFVSRAHANWAASAYPAASVLVAAWSLRANWTAFLKIGLIFNAVVGFAMLAFSISPAFADLTGFSNAIKRVRGWEPSIAQLDKAAKSIDATGIVFDEREFWHGMDYYGERLDSPPEHYLWQRHDTPHAFAESFAPVPKGQPDTYLIASIRPNFLARMKADFETLEPVGRFDIPIGGSHLRTFCLYKASNFNPVPRTLEYETEFKDLVEKCPYEENIISSTK
ncbi:ArnT family glycosyltransferase [Hirschia baltica]|uniref:Glycosyl transferase family 39 n=1 Tax=Hirschia baltica (strain ATCC 49814 / DSM 5838 / IFAM 1418) TaxID=582402 RepID=C6XL04_HIRBI|nr:glycosyltransferase family 39 protein [Hirschia baltica]ACT57833.1 glycosyl transferase family 39 [Hirschia baltica ATCC 49814]